MNQTQKTLISDLKKWIKENKRNPRLKDFGKDNLKSNYMYAKNFGNPIIAVKIANCKNEAEMKSVVLNFKENESLYSLFNNIKMAEKLGDGAILKRKLINLKKFIETENYKEIKYEQWTQIEKVIDKYRNIFQ